MILVLWLSPILIASQEPNLRPVPAVKPVVVVDTDKTKSTSASAEALSMKLRTLYSNPVVVVALRSATDSLLNQKLRPAAIFLSGQGTPWWEYSKADFVPISKSIANAKCPVIGICGGHQLIAMLFGGKVAPIKRVRAGTGYDGLLRERGYVAVTFLRSEPAIGGAKGRFNVWENHVEEVKSLPKSFVSLATGRTVPIQAMRHKSKPIFGVQFHPEKWDERNPFGQLMLNSFGEFCKLELKKPKSQLRKAD